MTHCRLVSIFVLMFGASLALAQSKPAREMSPQATADSTANAENSSEKPAVQIVSVQVGLGGKYRAGLWTPVEVTLRGNRSSAEPVQVSLVTPDGDNLPTRISTSAKEPVWLAPGKESRVVLYARFGRSSGTLTVEIYGKDSLVAQRVLTASETCGEDTFPPAIGATSRMIVAVGKSSLGVEDALGMLREAIDEGSVVASLGELSQLPGRWYGYEGIDLVVISTSEASVERGMTAKSPQIAALDQWVRMGGRLVLCVGKRAQEVSRSGGPLASFLPGPFDKKLVFLRQSTAVESYCSSSAPVPRTGSGGRLELAVPRLTQWQGEAESKEGNVPLVIRRPWGLGKLMFVALDLDTKPLSLWQGRPLFVTRLLDLAERLPEDREERTKIMHFGYHDLAGHLRSTLDSFEGIPLVSFSLVVGLVVAYLLLIGPADYFFLRKVVGRMTLTWITFPLVVIAFAAGAYVLAYRLKGDQLRLNQVDLVDIDVESRLLRGTSWMNFLSPRVDRYRLTFVPGLSAPKAPQSVITTWLGLPGEALGGMTPTSAQTTPWSTLARPYELALSGAGQTESISIVDMPVPIWSSKSLTARWKTQAAACVDGRFSEREHLLSGHVTNTLDFPLTNCYLYFRHWAYQLGANGTLKPGVSAQIGPMTERRDLNTILTGRRLIGEQGHEVTAPYDPGSTDPAYVIRTMMFYEAGGGRSYAGLANRYQGFVDCSDLLHTDRVILVATGPAGKPGAKHYGGSLLRDGQPIQGPDDRHITIFRFVFPVAKGDKNW